MDKIRFSQYLLLTIALVLSVVNLAVFLKSADKSEKLLLPDSPGGETTLKRHEETSGSLVYNKGLEDLNSKVIYLEERLIEIDKNKDNVTKKEIKEIGNINNNPNLLSAPYCVLGKDDFNSIISGNGYKNVIQSFGKPQKEHTNKDGSIKMNYYGKGMIVLVDQWGSIEKIEFFGKPRSDMKTASGRWANVYDEKGEWYEPNKWVIDKVGIGTHTKEVYRLWGKPDRRMLDARGGEYLVYTYRKIRLDIDRDYFVINIVYDKNIE